MRLIPSHTVILSAFVRRIKNDEWTWKTIKKISILNPGSSPTSTSFQVAGRTAPWLCCLAGNVEAFRSNLQTVRSSTVRAWRKLKHLDMHRCRFKLPFATFISIHDLQESMNAKVYVFQESCAFWQCGDLGASATRISSTVWRSVGGDRSQNIGTYSVDPRFRKPWRLNLINVMNTI